MRYWEIWVHGAVHYRNFSKSAYFLIRFCVFIVLHMKKAFKSLWKSATKTSKVKRRISLIAGCSKRSVYACQRPSLALEAQAPRQHSFCSPPEDFP